MFKLWVALSSLVVLWVMLGVGLAWWANYVLGYSSVDTSGGVKEIRWDGSTTYSAQLSSAIATWNARKKVNIAPDIVSTVEDLTIRDIYNSGGQFTGRLVPKTGADLLELNTYYLANNTNVRRQNTITHELGHALWLAHSPGANEIMYTSQTTRTTLGTQDISDYVYLYGK